MAPRDGTALLRAVRPRPGADRVPVARPSLGLRAQPFADSHQPGRGLQVDPTVDDAQETPVWPHPEGVEPNGSTGALPAGRVRHVPLLVVGGHEGPRCASLDARRM